MIWDSVLKDKDTYLNKKKIEDIINRQNEHIKNYRAIDNFSKRITLDNKNGKIN